VLSASKPRWQQVTAVVSLGASGAVTGFSFVPSSPADLISPTSMPIRLMALERSAQPARSGDAALRSAIVNVANYYLRMAQGKTPAEMEAIIWQHDSIDGVDHGESCAAFASLTLELAAQVVGQQSWVTGGTSYPWPLHKWADVRVDPNPASPDIVSILQDAEAHGRWHPLGDGYQPQPGDWVLFDGHVEVVTKYADGVLYTIGGDSLPNFSVNAHEYPGPLAEQGVAGFVNNGDLAAASGVAPGGTGAASLSDPRAAAPTTAGSAAAIPGIAAPSPGGTGAASRAGGSARSNVGDSASSIPGEAAPANAADAAPSIPGEAAPSTAGDAAPSTAGDAAPSTSGRLAPSVPGDAPPSSPERLASDSRAPTDATQALPTIPGAPAPGSAEQNSTRQPSSAAIPGTSSPPPRRGQGVQARRGPRPGQDVAPGARQPAGRAAADADVPGTASFGRTVMPSTAAAGTPAIPGLWASLQSRAGTATRYQRHRPPTAAAPAPGISAQQAFINEVAPGAMATQGRYGIPASVTIAQAINESGWGQSLLAMQDNNLFGIKGTGPAGSDSLPTQEYLNGQWVTTTAPFRVYHDFAESINDHGQLLATSGYYTQAMAERNDPNSFAQALTGVYATNPEYGTDLIQLMQQYDLYRYDVPASAAPGTAQPSPARTSRPAPARPSSAAPGRPSPERAAPSPAAHRSPRSPRSAPVPRPASSAGLTSSPTPAATPSPSGPPGSPRPARPLKPATSSRPASSTRSSSSGRPTRSQRLTSTERSIRPARVATPQPAAQADVYQPLRTGISSTLTFSAQQMPAPAERQPRPAPSPRPRPAAKLYRQHLPPSVKNDLVALAKAPLMHAELLYRDIAGNAGISWQLLAACDWMQCEARPRHSPVHGEKLGTPNLDGTVYRTKSEALEQCASDLVELAGAVYGIDLAPAADLSVRDLARLFAAFRWGGLLKQHHTSAMEFPYSVAGLTAAHLNMRWPNIGEQNTPDKQGARFRGPFGAVPVVLFLNYPVTD
jgi:flagellum-specific peptidoglycan hydrolase FlgJ